MSFSGLIVFVWLLLVFLVPVSVVMTVLGYMRQLKSDRSLVEELSQSQLQALNGLTLAQLLKNQNEAQRQTMQWGTVVGNPDFYSPQPANHAEHGHGQMYYLPGLANSALSAPVVAQQRKKSVFGKAMAIGFMFGASLFLVLAIIGI